MPTRMLREGILTSRAVTSLSRDAELFYRCLMSVVDDYGRHEADPEMLRVKCFPRRLDEIDGHMMGIWLADVSHVLTDDGQLLVVLYENRDTGKKYLQINKFDQRLRRKTSTCPAPDGHVPVRCPLEEKRSEEKRSEENTPPTPSLSHEGNPGWERFKAEYPGNPLTDWDCQVFLSVILTPADEALLFANLPAWRESKQARDGCMFAAENFLRKGIWKTRPKEEASLDAGQKQLARLRAARAREGETE